MKKAKRPTLEEQTKGLTPEQREHLLKYAEENGHGWKQKLNLDWMRAAARVGGEHSGYLQQVRNQLGPEWLSKVTLEQIRQSGVETCSLTTEGFVFNAEWARSLTREQREQVAAHERGHVPFLPAMPSAAPILAEIDRFERGDF